MSVSAGDLRWLANIESLPTAVTASGEPDQSQWNPLATRRVKIEETTGGTKVSDGTHQVQAIAWFKVTMRRFETLDTTVRLTISGLPFDGIVMYPTTVQHSLDETNMLCVQRAD